MRNYTFTFEDIIPTELQIKEFGDGSNANVKLTYPNILQIMDRLELTPEKRDALATYLTGKGRNWMYSAAYIKRTYNLSDAITEYNHFAHIFRQDLAHTIMIIREEREAKEKAEEFKEYQERAKKIIERNDVNGLASLLQRYESRSW